MRGGSQSLIRFNITSLGFCYIDHPLRYHCSLGIISPSHSHSNAHFYSFHLCSCCDVFLFSFFFLPFPQLLIYYYHKFQILTSTCRLESLKAQKTAHCLRSCVRMWSQQPLVKFRCPVKTLKGIFITSLCIRGLYFMRNLCFLGVTITFSFIFRVVFICVCTAFTAHNPFSSLKHHVSLSM